MKPTTILLIATGIFGLSIPAVAKDADFSVTYHVERTPAAQLGIDACGDAVADAAQQAGLSSDKQGFPGQLVTVSGGAKGRGAFIAQCIAVDDKTVSVVQGIDYAPEKAALGSFADQAFAAIKSAIR